MTSNCEPVNGRDRQTLCLPGPVPGKALHGGEKDFSSQIQRHYSSAESNAIEKLSLLKVELAAADTETFWSRLMEELTNICHAQYGFVAKRIVKDDHNLAVEMPPLGTSGSCLLGTAFYYNDGKDQKAMFRDYKYLAFGAPCGYMKHDKVFLIPNKLPDFIVDNPNKLPFPAEAYMGSPLFFEGKCFAHFGMMWSKEGLKEQQLSWPLIELIMHSLEDQIMDRLVKGESFARKENVDLPEKVEKVKNVIPKEAVTSNQSLKPFARSLSHELRTPMQGVVGMLDVMHATVQEAIEGQHNPRIRSVFQALRENIEVVQDSSRRAVEAADNVVHAYDMNMQIPETPHDGIDGGLLSKPPSFDMESRPSIFMEGHIIAPNPYKRRRNSPVSWQRWSPSNHRDGTHTPELVSPRSMDSKMDLEDDVSESPDSERRDGTYLKWQDPRKLTIKTPAMRDTYLPPSAKHSKLRDILHSVVNEGLLVGGRPDSAIAEETDLGESIEVRSRSSSGEASSKTIIWSVAKEVPDILPVDERDLSKLLSCTVLNAIKFTERGSITITAEVSASNRSVVISVSDTGIGIPRDFLPQLFKPFSREDDSTTRTKEGLGLGLLVAKGLARKIGGDIQCIRSETSGPNHGTEFEIRVPLISGDKTSRAPSPLTMTPTLPRTSDKDIDSMTPLQRSVVHGAEHREGIRSVSPPARNVYNSAQKYSTPGRLMPSEIDDNRPLGPRRTSTASAKMLAPSVLSFDRKLAYKHPLTFLVAEDNKINRKLLVTMLGKLGYKDVYEAFDGKEAVRIMKEVYGSTGERLQSPIKRTSSRIEKPGSGHRKPVDVILMDLWMPEMDGYEATEKILELAQRHGDGTPKTRLPVPTILAVTADATDEALLRATQTGMEGFMTKPYKLNDLQKLIEGFSLRHDGEHKTL